MPRTQITRCSEGVTVDLDYGAVVGTLTVSTTGQVLRSNMRVAGNDDVRLGDHVAKTIHSTTRGRIKPCRGCKKRQRWLNRHGRGLLWGLGFGVSIGLALGALL